MTPISQRPKFIDFSMLILRPRREYVGLMRTPLPRTLHEFLRQLNEAFGLGLLRVQIRYGRTTRLLSLQVQIRHRMVSQLLVRDARGEAKIRSWRVSKSSELYPQFLEWRYMRLGKVHAYYERLEKQFDPLKVAPERIIYRKTPQGSLRPLQVMRGMRFHMPEPQLSTMDRLRLMRRV